LLSMVFGFIEASTYGWFWSKTPFVVWGHTINFGSLSPVPVFIAIGIVLLFFFILWENHVCKKGGTPLVALSLFSNRQFVTGATVVGLLSLAQAGLIFAIPVYLQAVHGLDPLNTGIAMLPMSLAILVAAPFAAYLS